MANKTEGHAALKRSWTAQEILERLALCVDDDHCAGKCIEEPCVLQDTAFLCSVARAIETQRAEIRAQRQANEGNRVMVAKLREELQKANRKYMDLRQRTLREVQKLLEEGGES